MSEALSFEMAGIAPDGRVMQPDRRIIQFRMGRKHLSVESQRAGRPVYAPQVLFCVRHPGERDETVVEATETHKYDYPRHWQAFQEGHAAEQTGTPTAILFPGEPYIVDHLRGLHITTVEQLAGLTEAGLQRIGMGAREYQAKAQKFMEAAERSAPVSELEAKLAQSQDEIESLKAQMNLLLQSAEERARKKASKGDDE